MEFIGSCKIESRQDSMQNLQRGRVHFCKRSEIFGNGNDRHFRYLFNCRKSVSTRTSPVFLGCINVGAAHSLSWHLRNTPLSVNRSISFLVTPLYACGTGKGRAWYGFASSVTSSLIGLTNNVPRPPPSARFSPSRRRWGAVTTRCIRRCQRLYTRMFRADPGYCLVQKLLDGLSAVGV